MKKTINKYPNKKENKSKVKLNNILKRGILLLEDKSKYQGQLKEDIFNGKGK